jgi:hypothetical protein
MSRIATELRGAAQNAENLGTAFTRAFTKNGWQQAREASMAAIYSASAEVPSRFAPLKTVAAAPFKAVGYLLMLPIKTAFSVGKWLVDAPVALLIVKPIKAIVGAAAGFYAKFPRAASILTVVAAAVGIGSWLSRRGADNLQNNFDAALAARQQVPPPESARA